MHRFAPRYFAEGCLAPPPPDTITTPRFSATCRAEGHARAHPHSLFPGFLPSRIPAQPRQAFLPEAGGRAIDRLCPLPSLPAGPQIPLPPHREANTTCWQEGASAADRLEPGLGSPRAGARATGSAHRPPSRPGPATLISSPPSWEWSAGKSVPRSHSCKTGVAQEF